MSARYSIPAPARFAGRPLNEKGYIIPWFVAYVDGKPDFRTADAQKLVRAIRFKLCWLCGQPLGKYLAFVLGPMCIINRTISEPPAHRECADYALQVCPFLTLPHAQRREAKLPEDIREPAGIGLSRNPGVSCLWMTNKFHPFKVPNGILFNVGEPLETWWFREGRAATREEVMESIESGLPILRGVAQQDGPEGIAHLDRQVSVAMALIDGAFA